MKTEDPFDSGFSAEEEIASLKRKLRQSDLNFDNMENHFAKAKCSIQALDKERNDANRDVIIITASRDKYCAKLQAKTKDNTECYYKIAELQADILGKEARIAELEAQLAEAKLKPCSHGGGCSNCDCQEISSSNWPCIRCSHNQPDDNDQFPCLWRPKQ